MPTFFEKVTPKQTNVTIDNEFFNEDLLASTIDFTCKNQGKMRKNRSTFFKKSKP